MKSVTVVRSEPVPLFERAELPSNTFTGAGWRARHGCPSGGLWYGPARELEAEAVRDAVAHERACTRRREEALRQVNHGLQ